MQEDIQLTDEEVLTEPYAPSMYIEDRTLKDGFYSPSEDTQVIVVTSPKGGAGKTTIAAMVTKQLNWLFNREFVLGHTDMQAHRILIMSTAEYDDLTTHGIGYELPSTQDSETDGKNAGMLLDIIANAEDEISWEDIEEVFVDKQNSGIFYLPAMTSREERTRGEALRTEDYHSIMETCRKFFQFVIVDTSSMFYHESNKATLEMLEEADLVLTVIEADSRSFLNLFHLMDGMKAVGSSVNPKRNVLVVNKYASKGNPYLPDGIKEMQSFESIAASLKKYFIAAHAIGFSQPLAIGNILDNCDDDIKYAAAELVDIALTIVDDMVPTNDDEQAETQKEEDVTIENNPDDFYETYEEISEDGVDMSDIMDELDGIDLDPFDGSDFGASVELPDEYANLDTSGDFNDIFDY